MDVVNVAVQTAWVSACMDVEYGTASIAVPVHTKLLRSVSMVKEGVVVWIV